MYEKMVRQDWNRHRGLFVLANGALMSVFEILSGRRVMLLVLKSQRKLKVTDSWNLDKDQPAGVSQPYPPSLVT